MLCVINPATIGLISSAISALGGYFASKKKADSPLISAGQQIMDTASQYFMNRAAQNYAMNSQMKLARVQNQLQQAFWNSTFNAQNKRQDYLNRNAASIQKNSLRRAGLSAASLNESPFVTSANSGAIGGSIPSFSPITMDLASVRAASLENQKRAAEVDLIREQTEGQKETNKMLSSDAAYREAYNLRNLDTMWSTIQLNNWKTRLTEDEIDVARSTHKKLEQEAKNLMEDYKILQENLKQEQIKSLFLEPEIRARISNIISGTKLNYEQIEKLFVEEGVLQDQGYQIRIASNKLGIEADILQDLGKIEKTAGILGVIAKILIAAGNLK